MSLVGSAILLAEKINNYEADATSGTLWLDTQHFRVTVPTHYRWFVIGGATTRDVSAASSVKAYDVSDQLIHTIDSQGAATGTQGWPQPVANAGNYSGGQMIVLDAGEYIEVYFAVAQGAGASASCVVLEVPL